MQVFRNASDIIVLRKFKLKFEHDFGWLAVALFGKCLKVLSFLPRPRVSRHHNPISALYYCRRKEKQVKMFSLTQKVVISTT